MAAMIALETRFKNIFTNFAKDGRMTLSQMDKWLNKAGIIENYVNENGNGCVYNTLNCISMDLKAFKKYLSHLCKLQKLELIDVMKKLVKAKPEKNSGGEECFKLPSPKLEKDGRLVAGARMNYDYPANCNYCNTGYCTIHGNTMYSTSPSVSAHSIACRRPHYRRHGQMYHYRQYPSYHLNRGLHRRNYSIMSNYPSTYQYPAYNNRRYMDHSRRRYYYPRQRHDGYGSSHYSLNRYGRYRPYYGVSSNSPNRRYYIDRDYLSRRRSISSVRRPAYVRQQLSNISAKSSTRITYKRNYISPRRYDSRGSVFVSKVNLDAVSPSRTSIYQNERYIKYPYGQRHTVRKGRLKASRSFIAHNYGGMDYRTSETTVIEWRKLEKQFLGYCNKYRPDCYALPVNDAATWLSDAGYLGTVITQEEFDVYFKRKSRIEFPTFRSAIENWCGRKAIRIRDFIRKLLGCRRRIRSTTSVMKITLRYAFKTACKSPNLNGGVDYITRQELFSWLENSGIIGDLMTFNDCELCYNRFNSDTMDYNTFKRFLDELCNIKECDAQDIRQRLTRYIFPEDTVTITSYGF